MKISWKKLLWLAVTFFCTDNLEEQLKNHPVDLVRVRKDTINELQTSRPSVAKTLLYNI